ncbi:MAG TPA: hypothetical protein VNS58_21235 [Puia sp.]|nr:hypothetical protein [Puia sp.]
MELDSLKYVWHSLEVGSDQSAGSEAEIIALLHKRSRGPIAKMRRNLLGEIILVLATYIPTILFYLLDFEGRLSGIAWLLGLLMAVLAAYYYRKDRLLKEMQCVSCQVKSNLKLQVRTLKKYIRFYILSGTLMIPVMAILSYLLIRWKYPPPPGAALFYQVSGIAWWQSPLFWIGLLAPLTIGIYYVNVWYVNKLYGRHIKKLQELLEEMEGE